jgi:long-chain acyl-CoA synthetase
MPTGTETAGEDRRELRPRVLPALLDRAARKFPAYVALDFLGREWTYAELQREVAAAAAGLERLGLGRGDRFALCLPNSAYYVILYFAVLRLGAIVVNLNPLYTPDELDHLLADSGARFAAVPDVKSISAKLTAAAEEGTAIERVVLCPLATTCRG